MVIAIAALRAGYSTSSADEHCGGEGDESGLQRGREYGFVAAFCTADDEEGIDGEREDEYHDPDCVKWDIGRIAAELRDGPWKGRMEWREVRIEHAGGHREKAGGEGGGCGNGAVDGGAFHHAADDFEVFLGPLLFVHGCTL